MWDLRYHFISQEIRVKRVKYIKPRIGIRPLFYPHGYDIFYMMREEDVKDKKRERKLHNLIKHYARRNDKPFCFDKWVIEYRVKVIGDKRCQKNVYVRHARMTRKNA